jgi:hypothetical protein
MPAFLMRGYTVIWDCNGSLLLFLCGAGFCGGEALMEAALYLRWLSRAVVAVIAWGLGFAALAWFLKSYTDTDVPLADGFLTAGSLLGQVLLSRKN